MTSLPRGPPRGGHGSSAQDPGGGRGEARPQGGHGGADPFTGSHLFTCFRAMDWGTQVDMTQPLRRMKSEKSYFERPTRGQWRLTTTVGVPAAELVGK